MLEFKLQLVCGHRPKLELRRAEAVLGAPIALRPRRGLISFAPIALDVPEEVMVNNVNLAIELENLSCFIQD